MHHVSNLVREAAWGASAMSRRVHRALGLADEDSQQAEMTSTPEGQAILPRTRAEAVAGELRRLILGGEYSPGARLRQAEVAQRFGVSTTPVREAFTSLAREGLVRQDAHRGVVVFAPSLEELREIYEIRGVLEPLATEVATRQLSEEDLQALEEVVGQMRTAEPAVYHGLNREFHNRIYAAAGRPRLYDTIATLREASASYLALTLRYDDDSYRAQVQSEHEQIVEALQARAPKQAARRVRDHLHHNEKYFGQLVELGG
jgi:DNA-binding GntR family transcriptional regulator